MFPKYMLNFIPKLIFIFDRFLYDLFITFNEETTQVWLKGEHYHIIFVKI